MKKIITILCIFVLIICGCSNTQKQITLNIDNPNSFDAVDEIIAKAKTDSKQATNKDIRYAVDYLITNYSSFYMDNKTMELVIYYGSLLDYSCRKENKEYQKLGSDSVNSVKDVYRGIEPKTEHFSKTNYEQVHEHICKLKKS